MCGILGYYNIDHEPVDRSPAEVETLREMMRNRGPDAHGYLAGARKDWILAHRRLAIIDLSERGRQPMSTPDGALHISYNGEIYNYQSLRDALEKRGVAFRSVARAARKTEMGVTHRIDTRTTTATSAIRNECRMRRRSASAPSRPRGVW